MRTFIAVNLSEAIRNDLAGHLNTFRPLARAVSWVPAGNAHITMKFLGEVPENDLGPVAAGIVKAVESHHPFEVQVGGFGAFPNFKRPRVLWVGITGGVKRLAALTGAIDELMAPLGFAKEQRRFSPHITLGRIRKPGDYDQLQQTAESTSYASAPFTVTSVEIMKSVLTPQGAQYSIWKSIPLAKQN
jgi:2'-5' RNA ligase